VTFTSLPFNAASDTGPSEAAEQARQLEMVLSIARLVAMVLGPLMVVLLIWMILRKGQPRGQAMVVKTTAPVLPASGPTSGDSEPELEPVGARELPSATRHDGEQDRIRSELRSIAESNPASVAQLIRTWLAEDRR
jgi:flagellar biosynthesis/type III secretory pathway M-ring protein FliF/YscJ